MQVRFFPSIISATLLLGLGHSLYAGDLSDKEKQRVGQLFSQVQKDPIVREAKKRHDQATREYHEAVRKAMVTKDPSIEPALEKIRLDPGLLAEAIWQKRNRDFLKNLHFPVRKLAEDERKAWDNAMKKLRQAPLTKEFTKAQTGNLEEQRKLREEYAQTVVQFKKQARKALIKIDGQMKELLEKLEAKQAKAAIEETKTEPQPQEERGCLSDDMPDPDFLIDLEKGNMPMPMPEFFEEEQGPSAGEA